MSIVHTVRPGECFLSLAKRYGFARVEDLYEHPENAELRRARRDPSVLRPGDRVVVPDRDTRTEACATGQHHRFRAEVPRTTLSLRLERGHRGETYANVNYRLTVERNPPIEGTVDGDGGLEVEIDAEAQSVVLELFPSGGHPVVWPMRVGHLDPVDDASGARARLENLGYLSGTRRGSEEDCLRDAVKRFQSKMDLEPTGELDERTLDVLRVEHDEP